MNINPKPNQEALVKSKLQSGQYQSVDDVIQAALDWLDEQDKAIETREKVAEGIASLERGEGIDGETFVNQLLSKLKLAKEARK